MMAHDGEKEDRQTYENYILPDAVIINK